MNRVLATIGTERSAWIGFLLTCLLAFSILPSALAAEAESVQHDSGHGVVLLSPAELETLVSPVALYPDDLLAIVLPASTYPLEVVQAARFLERMKQDTTLQPDEDWDDSVIALLNYPEVLNLMNDDLDWMWKLGEAVVAQQQQVVAAVEAFRDRAYDAGNLLSDERQTVQRSDGVVHIEPATPEVIYVPYYEPERVVVRTRRPVYHYYPTAYPLYYYPYDRGHHFGHGGIFWGVSTAFSIGWASDYLHVYHHSYHGHPYYGRSYYGHNYRHASINVYNNYYVNHHRRSSHNRHRDGDYWRPRKHGGARPGHYVARNHYYNDRQQKHAGRSKEGRESGKRNSDARNSDTRNSGHRSDRMQVANNFSDSDRPNRTRPQSAETRHANTRELRERMRDVNVRTQRSRPAVASATPRVVRPASTTEHRGQPNRGQVRDRDRVAVVQLTQRPSSTATPRQHSNESHSPPRQQQRAERPRTSSRQQPANQGRQSAKSERPSAKSERPSAKSERPSARSDRASTSQRGGRPSRRR